MRAFVTGGTGFLGGRLVERLRGRGDEVVALVRSPGKAGRLAEFGCELAEATRGCDAVFHVAADYRIGIRDSERAGMFEVNVAGTRNVLDAAAGVGRIVYVSTNSVLGNTRGAVVDETYSRDGGDWLSA